jgi:hypothetical protein
MKRLRIRFRIDAGSPAVTVIGRNAWALQQLKAANDNGCTPIDNPGPRWSAYVHNLRKLGLVIETISERHGGPFAGEHARYVLRTDITIEESTGDSEGE